MTTVAERPGWAPGWTLTGAEILTELDAIHGAQNRLAARRLELLYQLDDRGHARDLGARDTVELISLRHRLDAYTVRRDLKTAHALTRHSILAAQFPTHPAPCDTAADAESEPANGTSDPAAPVDSASTSTGSVDTESIDHKADGSGNTDFVTSDRRRELARETSLNAGQAAVIAEILEQAPVTVRSDDLIVAETELVIAARTLAPRHLRRLGAGVLTVLDTDGPEPDSPPDGPEGSDDGSDAARRAQTLWFVPGSATDPSGRGVRVRGFRFGGFVTGADAELFQTLIDAAAKPCKTPAGELDPRTLGQRRADALAIVLRAAAATGGRIPAHGGVKPHLAITIAYDELRGAVRSDWLGRTASKRLTGIRGDGRTGFGDPLTPGDIRRIACDAGIIPIVLGTESEPLDVGREQRLVTAALRRALIARDGGCVIPGCGAPPGHCDAHHVVHWVDGGETSLWNLVLTCPPHHRAIHRGVWIVTITNGRVDITRPSWTQPGPSG